MNNAGPILIIEDNADVANTLATLLELEGYRAVIAADGLSGVVAAQSHQPAAILCDIGLPGLSGYEVARILRKEGRFHSVAMLAITGYAQFSDRTRALDAGFDDHMGKPVEVGRLLDFLTGRLGPSGNAAAI